MAVSRLITGVQAIVAMAGVMLAAGCAAASANNAAHNPARGVVTGSFVREGGPLRPGGLQPRKVPLPGLVEFISADGHVFRVRIEVAGKFKVSLPAGRYSVSGTSPDIGTGRAGGRQRPCSQPVSVTVTAHHTVKVTVACTVP